MTRLADKYVDQVRAIVLARTASLPVAVYLFGSRASGTASDYSDVDIAIEAKGPLPPAFFSDLVEELEESTVPYRVDVVNLAETEEAFRARVMATGIKWQG